MEKSIKKYWPIFVLPTFAAFIIGFIVPFIEGIYLSFCKFTTIRDASFVGLSNYVEAFKDQYIYSCIWLYSSFCCCNFSFNQRSCLCYRTCTDTENQRHKHFPYYILYA